MCRSPFSLESVKAQPADAALLKALYTELEFHSLLKELGPGEDTRAQGLPRGGVGRGAEGVAGSGGRARRWRWRLRNRAEGELALDTVGLAWRVGEARAVTAEYLPHLKGWLEDAAAAKVACDVKSALLALGRLGIEARGFEHDVMLYAFLLDADPSGCSLEEQARRRLDVQLGPAPEQHADITLELWKQLAPAVEARGMGKLYAEIELPLAPRAGAHGTGRRAHRHPRAAAARRS